MWCWDISWLPGPLRGLFYYRYLVLALYSRKIVAWEVHKSEASELAAQLIHKACLTEAIVAQPVDIKRALRGACHAIRPRYAQRYPAEFEYRFNRRFDLPDIIPRLVCVALRTPPLPERLLKLHLA